MVDLFGRKRKREEKEKKEQYEREVAYGETQRAPFPSEYVQSIGQTYFGIADPEVINMLKENEHLKTLLPAFSHLNRLTRIDKHEKEILDIMFRRLLLIHKTNMVEQEYDHKGWSILEGLKIFALGIISDAHQGFKGQMATEQLRRVEVITGEKRKRRLPM